MTKDELIDKVHDLYDNLLNREYEDWYNSNTLSSWEESRHHMYWDKLHVERQELISQIESSFNEKEMK